MRSGEAFVLGTIAGAAVVWLWGREIGAYTAESTRGIRARTACTAAMSCSSVG